ncbi:hypothetical protein SAMN06264849_101629 [Melghirimyces algeriensis]|uniref:Uncharacterized protein n=2 Tax=Melghirimyces algeriensis TaxID=910412 RepID=A0A521B8X5_9BACL|nr:hypothetical protein SAMN06264849_101629 [Melghirimyces algeriensis]
MRIFRLTFLCFLMFAMLWSVPVASQAQESTDLDVDTPIVLVHGIGGSSYNFVSIERALIRAGYDRSDIHAIEFWDKSGNNYINSRELRDFIDNILRKLDTPHA